MKKTNLYWMRGKARNNPALKNFGDWLSKDVFEYVSGREAQWENAKNADYLAIGSICERVNKLSFFRFAPLKIWGTGASGITPLNKHRCISVLACRGQYTRQKLSAITTLDKHLPLGDPGLFVSEMWGAEKNKRKIAVILNEAELEYKSQIPTWMDFVSPQGEPRDVVKKISGYKFIISSSLHGLVIADAYGIPCRLLKIKLDTYKFEDYFSAFSGREALPPLGINDLHKINPSKIEEHFIAEALNIADILNPLQNILINSLD